MKMKRSIAAAFAAVAFASATPALAANVDVILSDIAPGGPTENNFRVTFQSATTVSADLGRNVGVGGFLDRYFFAPTFLGVGSGLAGANQIANLSFGTPGLRIDGYSFAAAAAAGFNVFGALLDGFTQTNLAAYNADLAVVQNYLSTNPLAAYSQTGLPAILPGGGTGRSLSTVPLDTANFYVITIDGTGNEPGSIYSGNLSATSVPEPATWAMMLAGFGLIGFAMRRQRQSHPKVRFAF